MSCDNRCESTDSSARRWRWVAYGTVFFFLFCLMPIWSRILAHFTLPRMKSFSNEQHYMCAFIRCILCCACCYAFLLCARVRNNVSVWWWRTVCYVQLKLKSHYKRNSVRSLPTFEWERCTDEMTCSVFYFIFCLVVSHWQRRLTHQKVCVLCSFCSISKSAIRTNCCFERTAFWIHGWPTNRRRSSVSSSRMEKFELA